jgi:DNA-directed RNA polymerase specialized sigma24 family protein
MSNSPTPADDDSQLMRWFRDLEAGDSAAAHQLWNTLAQRIERFAARQMTPGERKVANEEDITIRVFKSVMLRAERGEFQQVQNYSELWGLLLTITKRKVLNHLRNHRRQKRGGGRVLGEGDLQRDDSDSSSQDFGLANVPDSISDPQLEVLTMESIDGLLKSLGDPDLQHIVVLKFAGHSNEQISKEIKRSIATVERKLKMIRTIWSQQDEGDSAD